MDESTSLGLAAGIPLYLTGESLSSLRPGCLPAPGADAGSRWRMAITISDAAMQRVIRAARNLERGVFADIAGGAHDEHGIEALGDDTKRAAIEVRAALDALTEPSAADAYPPGVDLGPPRVTARADAMPGWGFEMGQRLAVVERDLGRLHDRMITVEATPTRKGKGG